MSRNQDSVSGQTQTIELTQELDSEVTTELRLEVVAGRAEPSGMGGSGLPRIGSSTADAGIGEGAVLCGRYALEQPLGNGGMALISRARDLSRAAANDADRYVAVKRLRPELQNRPGSITRLRREFDQTRSLTHPGIVRFLDFDCHEGTWFIVMELLDGEALGKRLRRADPQGLLSREALRIAADCGNALEYAHRNGVVHGDIKPDNVFVMAADEVRILDFGAAESPWLRAAMPGAVAAPVAPAATRNYASPEVLAGQRPEPRDDVFSLACTVYEMLAGWHPYGRRGADQASDAGVAIMQPPGLGDQQWRALRAGLAWRRDQRPSSVRGLLQELGADQQTTPPVLQATWP